MVSIFPVRMESGSRHGVLRLLITRVTCSNITMETNSLSSPDRLAPLLALLVWKKKSIKLYLKVTKDIVTSCFHWFIHVCSLSYGNAITYFKELKYCVIHCLIDYLSEIFHSYWRFHFCQCIYYNFLYCVLILFTYCIMVCLSVGEAGWDL